MGPNDTAGGWVGLEPGGKAGGWEGGGVTLESSLCSDGTANIGVVTVRPQVREVIQCQCGFSGRTNGPQAVVMSSLTATCQPACRKATNWGDNLKEMLQENFQASSRLVSRSRDSFCAVIWPI